MPEGKKLAPQLTALLETAETLNTTSNSINTILHAVETQLVQANVGLEVWLEAAADRLHSATYSATDEAGYHCTYVELGFARLKDGWHLATREWSADLDRDGEEDNHALVFDASPLAEASRKERIAALGKLPDLIAALQAEAVQAIQAIEEAKSLIAC